MYMYMYIHNYFTTCRYNCKLIRMQGHFSVESADYERVKVLYSFVAEITYLPMFLARDSS